MHSAKHPSFREALPWLSGCDVDVNQPATPRVEVDADPPPKVDVEVDVKNP